MRVLVIEDDLETLDFIVQGLSESGHVADKAKNGKDGLFMALEGPYDALVVDRMLPGLDGLTLVQTLRSEGKRTPILILSALGEVNDRVERLRKGGDDYLVKPFAFSELLARLEVLARRGDAEAPVTKLSVGELDYDLLARTVTRAGGARFCCNLASFVFSSISCDIRAKLSPARCCWRKSGITTSTLKPTSSMSM